MELRGEIVVLHVDDDPEVAETTAEFLEREDDRFVVETATSAAAGLEALSALDPDCILSDYEMPGRDGIEFLAAVREAGVDVPFILYPGHGSEEVASEAIAAGVTDYLPKRRDTGQYAVLANRIADAVSAFRDDERAGAAGIERDGEAADRHADLRLYERAVESSFDLIAGMDAEYTLVFANERYRAFHGLAEEDVGSVSLPEVLGDAWDGTVADRQERVLDGEMLRYEVDRAGPDGEMRTFSVQDYPLLDDDGTVLGVVGSMRDITERTERERELRRLKERLDLAVEAANVGVWDWDLRTDAVEFNDQWAAMLGHAPGDIDPHIDAWRERLHPEDAPAVREALKAHFAGETEYYECDHRMRTADGGWKWIRDVGRVTEYEDGEPARAVGVHLDIDERKERERALRESEREYRSLFESNPAVLWVEDFSAVAAYVESLAAEVPDLETHLANNPAEMRTILEKVEIIDVSKQAVERYGADSKAHLMENVEAIFTPEAYDANVEVYSGIADGETHFRVRTVARTFDGERLDEIMDVRVPEAYADDYSRVYLTVTDITERKRHERKLTALHDVATDLGACEAPESVCERTLEAGRDILAFDLSRIDLGSDAYTTTPDGADVPEDARLSADGAIAGNVARTGESLSIADIEERPEAGGTGPFRSGLYVPIGDHGVFQALAEAPGAFEEADLELAELLVSHAASALDRLADERTLERHNERLEEFARIVSHDLRNPLTVARSQTELLRAEYDLDGLDAVARAHERMDTLIEDLLALTLEGDGQLDAEAVDLATLVEQCWGTVETAGATLRVETERTIRADRGQLSRVLENLIGNAVEHGSKGSPSQVPGEALEHGGDVTVTVGDIEGGFFVADDGVGIPEADRSSVFEAGYSTSEDGTGFGLAIVRRIADVHGWDIAVTAGPDGGTRFEITGVDIE